MSAAGKGRGVANSRGQGGSGAGAGAGAGAAGGGRGGSSAVTPGGGGHGMAQPLTMPSPGRVVAYVLLFVLGAVTGVAGALLQAAWFPGGLLLALAGSAGLFRGGARALGSRAGAVAPAAGWLVAVMWLTTARPEGDYMFGAQLSPYLFLLGGVAVAVISATLGGHRHRQGTSATLGR